MDEVQDLKSEPEMSPTSPFVSVTPSKGPLGLIIKIVLGLIVILVVGTGVLLGTRIWDPLWNPFRPEPERVIDKMGEKMKEVKTLHTDLNLEFDIKNESEFNIKSKIWADADNSDPKNLKSASGIDVNLAMEGIQLSLETKQIGEIFYMKLTKVPVFPLIDLFLTVMGIDLNELKNQWIKFDKESFNQLLGGEYYEELTKEQKEEEKKRETMIEEFKKIIENKKLYLVKKELPDEKIDDKKVYHYVVVLNNEEIKKIIPELFKTNVEIFGESDSIGIEEEFLKEMDEFFEKIGEITVEIWIGKKDNYLYKVKIDKEIDVSKFEEKSKGKATIKFDIELSNFNQPATIEAPENFIGIEEIITSLPLFQPGLPGETPGMYPPTRPEGLPSKYPYEQPLLQQDSSYWLQASLLGILSGLLR